MDHVAIMKKSWDLIPRILSGDKTIESRWGKYKCVPWGKVFSGDTIYFKNSGEPVTAVARVKKVIEYPHMTEASKKILIDKYGGRGKISFSSTKSAIDWAKDKRYCTLIFLVNVRKVRPFNINKKGFGTGSAWLVVGNIKQVKLSY